MFSSFKYNKSTLKDGFIGHPDQASSAQRLNRYQRRNKRNFLQEINRLDKGDNKHGQR